MKTKKISLTIIALLIYVLTPITIMELIVLGRKPLIVTLILILIFGNLWILGHMLRKQEKTLIHFLLFANLIPTILTIGLWMCAEIYPNSIINNSILFILSTLNPAGHFNTTNSFAYGFLLIIVPVLFLASYYYFFLKSNKEKSIPLRYMLPVVTLFSFYTLVYYLEYVPNLKKYHAEVAIKLINEEKIKKELIRFNRLLDSVTILKKQNNHVFMDSLEVSASAFYYLERENNFDLDYSYIIHDNLRNIVNITERNIDLSQDLEMQKQQLDQAYQLFYEQRRKNNNIYKKKLLIR